MDVAATPLSMTQGEEDVFSSDAVVHETWRLAVNELKDLFGTMREHYRLDPRPRIASRSMPIALVLRKLEITRRSRELLFARIIHGGQNSARSH